MTKLVDTIDCTREELYEVARLEGVGATFRIFADTHDPNAEITYVVAAISGPMSWESAKLVGVHSSQASAFGHTLGTIARDVYENSGTDDWNEREFEIEFGCARYPSEGDDAR